MNDRISDKFVEMNFFFCDSTEIGRYIQRAGALYHVSNYYSVSSYIIGLKGTGKASLHVLLISVGNKKHVKNPTFSTQVLSRYSKLSRFFWQFSYFYFIFHFRLTGLLVGRCQTKSVNNCSAV